MRQTKRKWLAGYEFFGEWLAVQGFGATALEPVARLWLAPNSPLVPADVGDLSRSGPEQDRWSKHFSCTPPDRGAIVVRQHGSW